MELGFGWGGEGYISVPPLADTCLSKFRESHAAYGNYYTQMDSFLFPLLSLSFPPSPSPQPPSSHVPLLFPLPLYLPLTPPLYHPLPHFSLASFFSHRTDDGAGDWLASWLAGCQALMCTVGLPCGYISSHCLDRVGERKTE